MLHIDHRPETLDEFMGNGFTVDALRQILLKKKTKQPRTFMFSGPSGCGKTTLARIMAKEMGAAGVDLVNADTASYRGIDTIRDIRKAMKLQPRSGIRRAWILDECHKLTNDAQNALLAALEEPPEHVIFMLATTDPLRLIGTIKNRCVHYTVRKLTDGEMRTLLKRIIKLEGIETGKGVLTKIVDVADGSPRQALQLLNKIGDLEKEDQLELVEALDTIETQVIDLCRAIFQKKSWKTVTGILRDLKPIAEPEEVRRAVLGYCSSILLSGKNAQAFIVMDCFREPFYNTGWPGVVVACYEANETEE